MEVLEAICSRRHIKQFKPTPISPQLLDSWLTAASYAPNHHLNQPWRILEVGPETRFKVGHKADFGNAPLVLAVLAERSEDPQVQAENLIAVACFLQNFALAAHADGAGVRWTSVGWHEAVRAALHVDDRYDVVNVMGVGYPAEVPLVKARISPMSQVERLP